MKKGILFSLMALGISALFLILFAGFSEQPVDATNELVNTRVRNLDQSIEDAFTFVDEAVEVAGYSALQELYRDVNASGFLVNFTGNFTRCTVRGPRCNNSNNLLTVLQNYSDFMLDERQIDLAFTVNNFSIVGEHHWSIEVATNISVHLSDQYASWNVTRSVITEISIIGLYDPAYVAIRHNGIEDRRIISNVDEYGRWDLERFMHFYHGKEYVEWSRGSCLSDRYIGDFSTNSDLCGIASVVDANEHPQLKDPGFWDIAHMDYQVIYNTSFPCNTSADPDDLPRISIKLVNVNLTLNQEDATHFGLANNSIWYYNESINYTTARGCPGFGTT